MESEMSTALSLLFIGMLTVFVVLTLVVLTGKLLIAFINKYIEPSPAVLSTRQEISHTKIAALTAAVEAFTSGQGHIQKIKKL